MATFKDDSGRSFKLAADGGTGRLLKVYTDGSGVRPEAAKGVHSSFYDEVKCPDCGKVGVAHATIGEKCPAMVKAKEGPRVCPNCHAGNPAVAEDRANVNDLCYHCGAPLGDDGEEPSMGKRQAAQTRYLTAMARSGHSEIARRGQDALARQLGPIIAADIISNRSTK